MKFKLTELEKVSKKAMQDENTKWLFKKHDVVKRGEVVDTITYEDIIRLTAVKYQSWCLEFDDLYSELSLFLLKRVSEYGGWADYEDSFDDPIEFTFKILRNKAIDIYRRARKLWDTKAQLIEEAFEDSDSLPHSSLGTTEDMYMGVLQKQFRDSYPVMSRPWIYVTLKLAAAGLIDESELAQYGLYLPDYGVGTNTGTQFDIRDIDIIPQMGFKSTRPSSYYSLKTEIKEELLRFLDGQSITSL